MDWLVFFYAFGGFVVVVVGALTTAWLRIVNAKLGSIQEEAENAKKHAEAAVVEVKQGGEKRSQQMDALTTKAVQAWDHANNTNDKLARQGEEILKLRQDITEMMKRLKP
jgi:hypothetical protein